MSDKKPLRILVIDPSGNLYGSELCLLDILVGINGNRFTSKVLLPRGAAFAERLREAGIPYETVLLPESAAQNRWKKLLTYVHLWCRAKPGQYDLIYLNEGGMLRAAAWIARNRGIPLVCQVQTKEDAEWISQMPASIHSQVRAFICNSEFTASCTQVPGVKKCTLYYGYRDKDLKRERRDKPGSRFVVGLLGRIGGTKGHDLVLDAAEEIGAAGDGNKVTFRFIGAAPTEDEDCHWKSEVQRRGLGNLIEFRGYRANIASEIAELDLMVIPSVSEPFGRILCEAAEARCPVLLSDSGGLGELSRHFEIGVRHESRSSADFARKLQWCQEHYEAVRTDFLRTAPRLLAALNYEAYLSRVEEVLALAGAGKDVSIQWKGNR